MSVARKPSPRAADPALRVLVVEDSPFDARLILEMLREGHGSGCVAEVVSRLADAIERLRLTSPDVVLLDLGLPDSQGMEGLQRVRDRSRNVPAIVLSGAGDEETVGKAAQVGAEDYLIKGRFDAEGLRRAIRYAVERRRVTEELRASEARFRMIAENAVDIVFRCRLLPRPAFEYMSPAVTRLLGYAPEEFYADPNLVLEIAHPEAREVMQAIVRDGLVPEVQLLRWRHRDGREIYLEPRLTPVREAGGALVAVEGIVRDVTERVRAEQRELMRAETLERLAHGAPLAQMLEAIAVGVEGEVPGATCSVLILDESRRRLLHGAAPHLPAFYNEAIHGLEIGPGVGSCGTAAFTGERVVVEDIETHPFWDVARDLARKAGLRACWSEPIRSAASEVLGTFAVYHAKPHTPDADEVEAVLQGARLASIALEKARAEAALRASEERYRTLFDRNLAGVYRTRLDGRILVCNDAFARIFGFASVGEALQVDVESLYAVRGDRATRISELREKGTLVNRESLGRRRDGAPVWLLENASLVGDGEPYLEGTVVDITERKALEEQLVHAQKLEAVGQLAAGVAHDFNNVLSVVVGYSELLLPMLRSDDPARAHIEEIRRAGDRGVLLARQLLAFSRKELVEPRVLDLNVVVAEAVPMLRRLIREDIEVVTALSSRACPVLADPGHIEQVLVNLAVNARDAMPRGGRLVIETARVEGGKVALNVTDTGEGMSAETLARIFEPFFTTKGPGKGTGLGLATVARIVKQGGGTIDAESAPGKGSTFRIVLPRAREAEADHRDPSGASAVPACLRETILVVEDEASLLAVVGETLESAGYRVLRAAGSGEGLEAARAFSGPIDLLLADIVMPGMRGTELAAHVKASHPEVRVMLMSGYQEGVIGEAAAADVELLAKPFRREALLRMVRRVLERPAS